MGSGSSCGLTILLLNSYILYKIIFNGSVGVVLALMLRLGVRLCWLVEDGLVLAIVSRSPVFTRLRLRFDRISWIFDLVFSFCANVLAYIRRVVYFDCWP